MTVPWIRGWGIWGFGARAYQLKSFGSRIKIPSCLHALRKPIIQGGEVSKSFLGNLFVYYRKQVLYIIGHYVGWWALSTEKKRELDGIL